MPEPTNEIITYQTPAMLMQLAVQKDFDIDRLKALMDLQERWEKTEAKKAFVIAMTEFKKNPPQIIKDMHVEYKTGSGVTKYNHASLGNVVGSVTESLSKYQMSVNWETTQSDKLISVTCKITHIAGYTESNTISAPPDTSGSKNSIQAIGSTITYLQRYTLLAICGLATNEFEDDGRQAENGKKQPETNTQSTNRPPETKNNALIAKEIGIGNMLMALTGNDKNKAADLLESITKSDDGKFKGIRSAKVIKSEGQAWHIISDIKKKFPQYDWKEFESTGNLVEIPPAELGQVGGKENEAISQVIQNIEIKPEDEPPF